MNLKTHPTAPSTDSDKAGRTNSVFSSIRKVEQPDIFLPQELRLNCRLKMDGLHLLQMLRDNTFPAAFLDPQYRGVLDYLGYGNEGEQRGAARASLPQMTEQIPQFVRDIDRILLPSGHLFLWMDKFHLCSDFRDWLSKTSFDVVDMITWHKGRMGMGYRSRRVSEHVVVLQKTPRRAKGVWKVHNIPDVWTEAVQRGMNGIHPKPVRLQSALIKAVSNPGDIVIDPAAGSFSVLKACEETGRSFLGCDING